ncbi:MAG: glycosyltransferase [Actinomycetota bacterium]
MSQVVALVPAFEASDLVGATVRSLQDTGRVHRIVVIDDGSTDGTADAARATDAEVIRLDENVGKGGALAHGRSLLGDETSIVLLVDSDLGDTAAGVVGLLDHVRDDRLVIGVPVDAAGRGGFGLVRDLAAEGIERATGWRPVAPLSGQRAMSVQLFDAIDLAPRFAVETAMTIDAIGVGATVEEVPITVDHRHHGRTWRGFRHRAVQGAAVLRGLRPRLGTIRTLQVLVVTIVRRFRR